MNINRWGASLIDAHLTLNYCTGEREREREIKSLLWNMSNYSCCWGFTLSWLNSILTKFCGVLSLVASPRKIFVFSCVVVLVFLSVIPSLWLWYYDVKCFRYCITIKNITWYHIHLEIILSTAKTLLQLQLLEIRVSCLKTLEGKI